MMTIGSTWPDVGFLRQFGPGPIVWAYCLMRYHVQLIMVPQDTDGLRRAIGEAPRRFSRLINHREGAYSGRNTSPHSCWLNLTFWPSSGVLGTTTVRGGLRTLPEDWPRSRSRLHLSGEDDLMVRVAPMVDLIAISREHLHEVADESLAEKRHAHTWAGRPLGADALVRVREARRERRRQGQKRGS
jgi:putative transposase